MNRPSRVQAHSHGRRCRHGERRFDRSVTGRRLYRQSSGSRMARARCPEEKKKKKNKAVDH
jgi:hypothetical protein